MAGRHRFYLDNDVDVSCGKVLRSAGHDCWTAADSANQDSNDDDQTVYATDRDAVLITHDQEFTDRRKLMPIGQHIRVVCHQLDAPDLLSRSLDQVVAFLQASPNIVIEVSPGRKGLVSVKATFGTEAEP